MWFIGVKEILIYRYYRIKMFLFIDKYVKVIMIFCLIKKFFGEVIIDGVGNICSLIIEK